jgi:predicted esterase YcpF (UPF0227 family)
VARTVLYIHGFNSSALSFKARVLRSRLARLGREDDLASPDLPRSPREAVAYLESIVLAHGVADTTLVGSSLGGYYATWLGERLGVRAVLINPAVRPYELLRDYVGTQTNLHTGEPYEFTQACVEELRALEVESITRELSLLMVTTADEVLDYRDALAKYRGCREIVIEGGDHGVSDFDAYADVVLEYCGIAVHGTQHHG